VAARRRSDCQKSLLTPRFDRRWGQDRGGSPFVEQATIGTLSGLACDAVIH
jgi:hypothetical protein